MATTHRTPFATVFVNAARASWLVLPVTVGAATADAMADWPTPPSITAAVLAWTGWAVGLLALLAPRPTGFTVLRVAAPAALGIAALSADQASKGTAILSVTSGALAFVLALNAAVADACATGSAYGSEVRLPLRAPTALLVAPIPLAVASVTLGVALPAIWLADERFVLGGIAAAVAVPVVVLAARALRGLERRWVVTVPAGVVVVDPYVLSEPILLPREHITHVGVAAADATGADLRSGAVFSSIQITLSDPAKFGCRKGRGAVEATTATQLLVAPLRIRDAVPHLRAHIGTPAPR